MTEEHSAELNGEYTLPEEFRRWSSSAQRAWLSGGLTQRQMLEFAIDELGLTVDMGSDGSLTNRDLARFIVAITEQGGVNDAPSN